MPTKSSSSTATPNTPSNTMPNTLPEVWQRLWAGLSEACGHPEQDWSWLALATQDDREVSQRMMVVRRVDLEQGLIELHTDRRSPKFATLRRDARAHGLLFDRTRREQARLGLTISVATDGPDVQAAWDGLADSSRRLYATQQAPGADIDVADPRAAEHPDVFAPAPMINVTDARANFAVLSCRVWSIDWLLLGADHHRRARFDVIPGEHGGIAWDGAWLVP